MAVTLTTLSGARLGDRWGRGGTVWGEPGVSSAPTVTCVALLAQASPAPAPREEWTVRRERGRQARTVVRGIPESAGMSHAEGPTPERSMAEPRAAIIAPLSVQ